MLTKTLQVPHAFQDILGAETTPTLPHVIPAFSALIQRWNELKDKNIPWHVMIQPGLEKLRGYEEELSKTPAYFLAMGVPQYLNFWSWSLTCASY